MSSPLFTTILVPVDFSDTAALALEYAVTLAKAHNSKLHVLHIVERPDARFSQEFILTYMTELKKGAEQELADFIKDAAPYVASTEVVEGVPFFEILRAAHQREVDLIVMGTHGRSGLAHLLIGSTAEKVVRKANCAVLTVKGRNFRFQMPFEEAKKS